MGNSPRAIVRGLIRGGRAVTAQWNRWGLMITLTCVLVFAGCVALYFFGALQNPSVDSARYGLATHVEQGFYAGMYLTVSIMLWSAAMTIWLLGAFLLRGRTSSPAPLQFFLTTALFSFLLMMEDAVVIPSVLLWVSPELSVKVLMGANVLFMLVYVRAFARQILESEYLFFVAALACFALSIGICTFAPHSQNSALFSDCFMLVGIALWTLYPAMTIPFFLRRIQLLEWSKDTIRFMVGGEQPGEEEGWEFGGRR